MIVSFYVLFHCVFHLMQCVNKLVDIILTLCLYNLIDSSNYSPGDTQRWENKTVTHKTGVDFVRWVS